VTRRQLHNRSATLLELPGTDWGGDPLPPGPLTGNEREREEVVIALPSSTLYDLAFSQNTYDWHR